MTTPRGKLWFSEWCEELKFGVGQHGFRAEHQDSCAEHQRLGINHQKVDVGNYSINLNFLRSSKKRNLYNEENLVHSIKKASEHSILGFDALKVLAKRQYFQWVSDFLSHSKTVGPGFKS